MWRTRAERQRNGRSPRRRGGPHLLRRFFRLILTVAAFLIVGGFFLFADGVQRSEPASAPAADGIVVLTGGASRIEDAVVLLAAKRGKRLLISGVNPGTTADQLKGVNPDFERLLSCCIDLGHEAENTIGNAMETGRWVREQKFSSLIVVTSSWHMPRALVEIGHELPDIELIPYPVVSERMREEPWWSSSQTVRLLILEYAKYLAAYVRVRFGSANIDAWDKAVQV
jgi:uncharacterized SAM-binding protein YcdF (DUF218 family)